MKKLTLIILLLSFSISSSGQAKDEDKNILDLCSVINQPQPLLNKTIRIEALYNPGYHDDLLRDEKCNGFMDVEFSNEFSKSSCGSERTERVIKTYLDFDESSLKMVLRGVLRANDENRSGFVNIYEYRLSESCIEDAFLMPREQNGCKRIDETMPFQYLAVQSYESGAMPDYGTGKFMKDREGVILLKLVNNSQCPIFIPVDAAYNGRPVAGEKVPVVFSRTTAYRGSYMSLGGQEFPITSKAQKLIALPSGVSITFASPAEYYPKDRKSIILKYRIKDINGPEQELYLRSDKM